jgi:hypothetical protein
LDILSLNTIMIFNIRYNINPMSDGGRDHVSLVKSILTALDLKVT